MLLVKHIGDEIQVTDRAEIDTKLFFFSSYPGTWKTWRCWRGLLAKG